MDINSAINKIYSKQKTINEILTRLNNKSYVQTETKSYICFIILNYYMDINFI